MQGTVRAAVLGTVLAAVLGMSLTACGSTPPSASAVLKSDGYSTVVNETQATINSSFGSAAPYVTSAAVGEKTGATEEEVVIAGNTINGVTGASFLYGLESQLRHVLPKTAITVSGDVLRITAPLSSVTSSLGKNMRKFSKVRYLTTTLAVSGTAATLAVSGVIAPPASAATAPPSAACTAAMQTYNADHAAWNALLDKLSAAEGDQKGLQGRTDALQQQVDADNTLISRYNGLEGEDEDAIQAVEAAQDAAEEFLQKLGRSNPVGDGHLEPSVIFELAENFSHITTADIVLASVNHQLSALDGPWRQAMSEAAPLTDDLNADKAQLAADDANVSALTSQADAAGTADQAALTAMTSACQGMTTPTATPASGSPTTTPSGDGSTQQYYQNGATFVLLDAGIILTSGTGGSVQADCAETAADPGADNTGNSGAGRAGNFPQDTGPTVADQTAWISGCVAQENAYPVSVLSSATPVATTPAATTPAATASPTPAATA